MPKQSVEARALMLAVSNVASSTTLAPGPGAAPTSVKAAIRRCCAAWQRAFDAYMADKEGDDVDKMFAAKPAGAAYCNAMPMLATYEGIRDFIACAAHGVLLGAIPTEKSGSLLYAAQVALATLRQEPKTNKSASAKPN